MFYTIYKITNITNGKIYIGKHQTKDLNDGYMGSGKHLKRAIDKYGIENFEKEILFQFDNEADMNAKEAELVTEEFVKEDSNYNLCPGGNGGFGYINQHGLGVVSGDSLESKRMKNSKQMLELHSNPDEKKYRLSFLNKGNPNGIPYFKGKQHTTETKLKIGEANSTHQTGSGNSQFGTMWITNGKESKKVKKDIDIMPAGWYKGRTMPCLV